MANELQTKLDAILQDKNTNLLPENLKSGVTCLGVNGTLVSGDFGSITAVPADVKKGKKFIDTTGVLRKGTFPDISYSSSSMMSSYSVVKSDLDYHATSYYRDINLTKQFNGLIYNSFNGKLEVKNSNDVLVELELAEKPYIMSVGCKDVFGENSVLIACTYSDRIDFYIHNYVDNTLGSFGTINASDYDMRPDSEGNFYPVCFLSPYYNFISISWGIYDNTNESFCWVCKLKPNLAFDKIQKLFGNTRSNMGSFLSFAYWVSKDLIYKGYCSLSSSGDYLTLIPKSSMSYLYGGGVSSVEIDSSIISVDMDQKYCITNPSSNLKTYYLRALVFGSSNVELGDIIETFTITNRILTNQTVIQGDLIVSADYVSNNFTSKFYKLDRNTNSVTEIDELIPNCEPVFSDDNLMFLNYGSKAHFYILVETIQNITSMSYDNKLFINTSDANATANDIVEDKTAYVNGEKITGTMPNNGDVTIAPTTSEQVKEKGYYNSLKVSAVTSAIDSNITPENIKKDVSILGVTGILEAGSISQSGIKQFSTIEEMNNSTDNKEGDLAIVYRSEMQNIKDGDIITSITFPKTVIFDTAITTEYYSMLRNSTEPRIYLDIQLSSTNFIIMDINSTIPEITYTSSDGITYTRTDTNADTYKIGETTISDVDEHIYKFIQVGGNIFEGLYQYSPYTNGDIYAISRNNVSITENKLTIIASNSVIAERELMEKAINKLRETTSYTEKTLDVNITMNATKTKLTLYTTLGGSAVNYYVLYNDKIYVHAYTANDNIRVYEYDITSNTITSLRSGHDITITIGSTAYNCMEITDYYLLSRWDYNANYVESGSEEYYVISCANYGQFEYVVGTTNKSFISNLSRYLSYAIYYDYFIAPTQLSITSDYVYEKEFYGKNGVESGTLQNKENLTKDEVKRRVDIWANYNSGIVCPNDSSEMFSGYTNLTTIPLLNTSSVTTMYSMFNGCTNLTTIPELDTSNVIIMQNTFNYCPNLSDESLNNILAMCTNATSYTRTKTLKYIGLTSAQATKCQSLSNYSAFTSAGWTTGY